MNLGQTRRVSGTPTIFVTHGGTTTPLPPGGVGYPLLKQYLDYLLQTLETEMAEANDERVRSGDCSRGTTLARWLLLRGALALGGIFVFAAYSKLRWSGQWHLADYQFIFAIVVDSYKMLPLSIIPMVARIVPPLEVVLGLLLLLAWRCAGWAGDDRPAAGLHGRVGSCRGSAPGDLRLLRSTRR